MQQPRPTSILHRTPWRPPVAVSGKGIYIELEDGRKVIDAVGGAAVTCIGNGHPEVVKAIQDQIETLAYVYNMQLSNGPAERLAEELVASGNGAFELCGYVSGGSEAMEAALKLARQYFQHTGQPQRSNFIARHLSYHGNTLGTLSVASHPGRRGPYEGILDREHFHHVSPAYAKRFQKKGETEEEYVARLAKELDDKFTELGPDTVIAFVAETVVGATTGVVPAPKGYFKAMKEIVHKHGALFILDEIMCGMGRMGTLHAWESFGDGAAPDIQAVAKGLGGGYASIGAVLINKCVASGIRDRNGFWQHGHTYQAHPMACAASLAVQTVIRKDNLLANNLKQGAHLFSLLRSRLLAPDSPVAQYVFDIRGGGLWYGIEFAVPSKKFATEKFGMLVQARCLVNGLIIMGLTGGADIEGKSGDHCMLSPAYNVTREEIETIVDIFVQSVEEVVRESGL
ncbi:pyridoxal phosphate-dependent transferase [Gautieria morchelliformis]|nr:pyridoxal phosphate-dependent transferase [Gautieria morchelliformis]